MAVLGMTLSSENKGAGPAALYSQPRRHLSYEMGGWEGGPSAKDQRDSCCVKHSLISLMSGPRPPTNHSDKSQERTLSGCG